MPTTNDSERVQLIGPTASPYTQKMVALLRYRHIPYSISWGDPEVILDAMGIERPKPILMPTFLFEEGGKPVATTDSTPIIRRLESMFDGRSVLPTDPALAFIDYLIEDFADEWCTKYMFHYRWYAKQDAENASTLLPLGLDVSMPAADATQMKNWFIERQVGRLYVVGSNDTTAPMIDASYLRFLAAMENHLKNQHFMLGNRPGAGDFSLFGQLSQLVGFDPTPRNITHEVAPRTVAWTKQMEDKSGITTSEDDWMVLEEAPDSLREVLTEIGRVYAPALLANAHAMKAGEKTWEAKIDGATWTQKTFPYQTKCLMWINEQYRALSPESRARVDHILEGTGCEAILLPANS